MDVLHDQRASRPLSVKEIDEQASDYQWNPAIPFKYWVRAAETIYLEVRPPVSQHTMFPVPEDL